MRILTRNAERRFLANLRRSCDTQKLIYWVMGLIAGAVLAIVVMQIREEM